MKKTVLILFIFLFFFLDSAYAQTTIKAEVDKTTLTTDDTLTYKLIITSSEKKIPAPQVPKFEGFNIISQAQSSTLSFVKGNIKTILVYAFILAPTDIGKFKIEPSQIIVKGKTYSSEGFEIEVTQGKMKPKIPPEKIQPESETPQVTL
jgi:hypothetical protein